MRWLSVCVSALVWVTAAPAQLRCELPCEDGAAPTNPELGFSRTFMIKENKIIEIYYKTYGAEFIFSLNCHGHRAFDYSDPNQLPSFSEPFRVDTVVLESCPPPTDRSYQEVLTAMNVTLKAMPDNNHTFLKLLKLPLQPKLARNHFAGLEHLTNLTIDNEVKLIHPKPSIFFLCDLPNLINLEMKRIKTPFKNPQQSIMTQTFEGPKITTKFYGLDLQSCPTDTSKEEAQVSETSNNRYRPHLTTGISPSNQNFRVYNAIRGAQDNYLIKHSND